MQLLAFPSVRMLASQKHDGGRLACVPFLAGQCGDPQCGSFHPEGTAGWELLRTRWGLSHRDFDYAVLLHLSTHSAEAREAIVGRLATANLRCAFYGFNRALWVSFGALDCWRVSSRSLHVCSSLCFYFFRGRLHDS